MQEDLYSPSSRYGVESVLCISFKYLLICLPEVLLLEHVNTAQFAVPSGIPYENLVKILHFTSMHLVCFVFSYLMVLHLNFHG